MDTITKPTIIIHAGVIGVECIETNIPDAQVLIIDNDVPECVDKNTKNLVDISETEEPQYVWVSKEMLYLVGDNTIEYYENLVIPKQEDTKNEK